MEKLIKDEELTEALNKIVSRETERQSKFNKAKVNELNLKEDREEKADYLCSIIAEITELHQAVVKLAMKSATSSSKNEKMKNNVKTVSSIQDLRKTKCNHCWRCGSEEHYSYGCSKTAKPVHQQQENSSRLQGGGG